MIEEQLFEPSDDLSFPLETDRGFPEPCAFLRKEPDHAHFELAERGVIFAVGDRANRVFRCRDAAVLIERPLPNGGRAILDIVPAGRLFGFSHGDRHDCAALAAGPTDVEAFRLDALNASAEGSRYVFSEAVAQMDRLARLAALRHGATVPERIGSFLTMQRESCRPEETKVRLPVSRRDLANHLMTTVESLSRAFAIMKRAEILGERSRNVIDVLDPVALRAIACGKLVLDESLVRKSKSRKAPRRGRVHLRKELEAA